MGTFNSTLRGRLLAGSAAALLAATLASCGVAARPDSSAAASPPTGSTAASDGAAGAEPTAEPSAATSPPPTVTPTPTPSATPGMGPACAAVRCTSVLVTGDMLVHAQLWEQARADALATGAKGLDFGPLLAGQRKYIEKSDLAICHQETPVAGPHRTLLRVPLVQRSAADHHGCPPGRATRPAPPQATTRLTAAPRGWSEHWMHSTRTGCSTPAPTGAKPTPRVC